MKIIASMFLAGAVMASPVANAGEYTLAMLNQQMCKLVGKIGMTSFDAKTDRASRKEMLVLVEALTKPPKPTPSKTDLMMMFAIENGLGKAHSREAAYEMAWANCMDAQAR